MKDGSCSNKLLISDDNIIALENSIESLKEIIAKFKLSSFPSILEKDAFFEEYIYLEDKILNELEYIKANNMEDERVPKLVEDFSKMWSDYQDSWTDEYWELYENRRNLLEKQSIGMNFTKFNEDELTNNNFVFITANQQKAENGLSGSTNNTNNLNNNFNNETFNKIDNDIESVDQSPLPRKEEKKNRTCSDCIIF